MSDEMIEVGQTVRIRDLHKRGIVREIDTEYFVARIALHAGGEAWHRLDEIEAVPVWNGTEQLEGAYAA